MDTLATLDQHRARHILRALDDKELGGGTSPRALKQVVDAAPHDPATAKGRRWLNDFVGTAKSLPAAILINGFGMAVATVIAQEKDETAGSRKVVHLLADWLLKPGRECGSPYAWPAGSTEACTTAVLVEKIIGGSQADYMAAQAEALAWLAWLKVLTKPLEPKDQAQGPSAPAADMTPSGDAA
jgi:hypothetical protein